VQNLGNSTEEYKNNIAPNYYDILTQYYSETDGPYLLGDKVTYADFAVYQSIDNDLRTGTLPVSTITEPLSANTGSLIPFIIGKSVKLHV
jgi:glutathione S-transferase